MPIRFIIFLIIHVVVLAYLIELLRRTSARVYEHPLEDDEHTIPFGFLKLRYVIALFMMFYVFWVLFSIWLYSVFIDPNLFSLFDFSLPESNNNLKLDL